jgi:hypothetical protein
MIWEGNCQIDFREIRDNIAFIYENEAKNENAVSDS